MHLSSFRVRNEFRGKTRGARQSSIDFPGLQVSRKSDEKVRVCTIRRRVPSIASSSPVSRATSNATLSSLSLSLSSVLHEKRSPRALLCRHLSSRFYLHAVPLANLRSYGHEDATFFDRETIYDAIDEIVFISNSPQHFLIIYTSSPFPARY